MDVRHADDGAKLVQAATRLTTAAGRSGPPVRCSEASKFVTASSQLVLVLYLVQVSRVFSDGRSVHRLNVCRKCVRLVLLMRVACSPASCRDLGLLSAAVWIYALRRGGVRSAGC